MSRKRGSITLETAIALPLLLFVAMCLLQYSTMVRMGLLIRNAADNTAAETALILAAADALSVDDILQSALSKGGEDTDIPGRILDAAAVLAGGPFIRQRMIFWLNSGKPPDPLLKNIRDLEVVIEGVLTGKEIYIRIAYKTVTLLGLRTASFETHLPVSTNPDSANGGLSVSDDIWARDNLTRGRIFRIRNGGNLPIGYPVLSGFREGIAMNIRSIDTTAPTMQDEDNVFREICSEVDALISFNGTEKPWGKSQVWIREEDITRKELLLVIPENQLQASTENGIDRAFEYASQKGVSVSLSRQGQADRESGR